MTDADKQEKIRLRMFGRTDVGQVREHNEDNFLIANLSSGNRNLMEADRVQEVGPHGITLGVCDGMGGAAAGEVASQLAIDIIYETLIDGDAPKNRDELARRLVSAVEEAGARIFSDARADRTRRGMGTTATIAALIDSRLFIAQVGDSRAYVLRKGELVQVSRDQSLVNQLIEAGQLTEEEAETFEHNNIILQALGTAETVQVDLTYVDLRTGDALLLCSDGLSGMIRPEEIRDVLCTIDDPFEACQALTERANAAGGHDNITVIVARFDAGLPEVSQGDELLYQKYALPETDADSTVRAPSVRDVDAELPTSSSEDTTVGRGRGLRVSHTVVGNAAALSAGPVTAEAPRTRPATAPHYSHEDDPVHIPTTGIPPAAVGVMVLGAMVAVALAGFFLLR